jgi:hypothetical protein
MSVSFYVDGDDAHTESYECQCNWDDQGPNPDCSQCNGTGTVSFSVRNTEFNMSNSNFYFFWSNLGLMENHNDCCGSISPDDLEKVLDENPAHNIWARDTRQDLEYIQRRINNLRSLIATARTKQEPILWC